MARMWMKMPLQEFVKTGLPELPEDTKVVGMAALENELFYEIVDPTIHGQFDGLTGRVGLSYGMRVKKVPRDNAPRFLSEDCALPTAGSQSYVSERVLAAVIYSFEDGPTLQRNISYDV